MHKEVHGFSVAIYQRLLTPVENDELRISFFPTLCLGRIYGSLFQVLSLSPHLIHEALSLEQQLKPMLNFILLLSFIFDVVT